MLLGKVVVSVMPPSRGFGNGSSVNFEPESVQVSVCLYFYSAFQTD